jgi:tetratricopeptide (TPR) repeat protein
MEILLAALAEAIFGVLIEDLAQRPRLAALRDKLRGDSPEKLALQRALSEAYAAFAERYPELAAAFFDEPFLSTPEVVAELAKSLTPNRTPDARTLDGLWRAQFRHGPTSDFGSAITFFINGLREAIKAEPALKPFVDSRAFDQLYVIADRENDQVRLQTDIRDALFATLELIKQTQRAQLQSGTAGSRTQRPASPRILPNVDTSNFTGRDSEVASLAKSLQPSGGRTAIGLWGGPGIGKSALAHYFAEKYGERFPDGIVGLNVWNQDARVLAPLFASLIDDPLDPREEPEPAAIMQSRFSGRRALLILDNADRPDIRELMPGGLCTVIITTRDRELLDHAGLPQEMQICLRQFDTDESLTFLARLIGDTPVRQEESAVRELAGLVGNLPLALRIAGASLRSDFLRPDRISRYVADLSDERKRLSLLQWRDVAELNVLAVFHLSLASLTTAERTTFACLAVCAESGFGLAAAAATSGLDEDTAALHLSRLVNLSLIEYDQDAGRFAFHTLVRLFARTEAQALDVFGKAQARHAWFFSNYVYQRQVLSPANLRDLEVEQAAILQVARWKIDCKDLDLAFWYGLHLLLEQRGYWQSAIALLQAYIALAEERGEAVGAAQFRLYLGKYLALEGRYDDAISAYQHSLEVMEKLNDKHGAAMVLNSLGGAWRAKGRFDDAIAAYQRSLRIEELLSNQRGVAKVLNSLGGAWQAKGRFDDAIAAYQRSLKIEENFNDRAGTAMVLHSLGSVFQAKRQVDNAIDAYRRSLEIEDNLNDQRGIAMVLNSLGWAWQAKGRFDDAIATFQRSLEIEEKLNNQRGIAMVLHGLGKAWQAKGKFDDAIATFQRSLVLQP